jgi:formate dehydrogenase subunit beta
MWNETEKARSIAREILKMGIVHTIIGWERMDQYNTTFSFFSRPEELERLVVDQYCAINLAKYLVKFRDQEGRVAVFVKGCDSRTVMRLLQAKQIERRKAYLIGIPCPGMLEIPDTGCRNSPEYQYLKRCNNCHNRNPVIYNTLLGDPVSQSIIYHGRCYGCRNVCEICNCSLSVHKRVWN